MLQPEPFNHRRYVPIILTRQGERHALRVTVDSVKDAMTPLFVIHPIDNEPGTETPVRSVDAHLEKIARELSRDWGSRPAFIDASHVDEGLRMAGGLLPIEWLVHRASELGMVVAPAVSMNHNAEYRAAALAAARSLGRAPLFRLDSTAWTSLGSPVGDGRLFELLAESRLNPAEVHLMLDCGEIGGHHAVMTAAVSAAIDRLPHSSDWASLTVAGTGMPIGTQAVGRDSTADIPRTEWLLWMALASNTQRRTSFGDYCVQNPDPISNFDPRFMDSSAQLRYTTSNSWFVTRGSGVRRVGRDQVCELARLVVGHPEFCGAPFSWGDQWIAECADEVAGPGSQGVWRKATSNHHFAFVVNQLANLGG